MIIVLKQSDTLPQAKLILISSTEQEKEKKRKCVYVVMVNIGDTKYS